MDIDILDKLLVTGLEKDRNMGSNSNYSGKIFVRFTYCKSPLRRLMSAPSITKWKADTEMFS